MMAHNTHVLMELTVNGEAVSAYVSPGRRLLEFLREDLRLTGTKEGCSEGECGSCTVLLDGQTVLACLTPMEKAIGRELVTIEGVGKPTGLHPLQQAMIEQGGVQCGFCTPGMVMSGIDLLNRIPQPTRAEIIEGISGNLCRCTGYQKIIRAIQETGQTVTLKRSSLKRKQGRP